MTVPEKFRLELLRLAASFSSLVKKTATLADAHTLCGRAGRLAQVIPEAKPFTSALFASLAASLAAAQCRNREAPPGKVAVRRYRTAAKWLVQVLQGEHFVLHHTFHVHRSLHPVHELSVEFDASPWGGGALLVEHGEVKEHFVVVWSDSDAAHLGVTTGIPAWQSFWELAVLVLSILKWSWRPGISFLGDNIASLELALSGKASGAMAALARELFWRKAREQLYYGVAHLASEANTEADALSRFAQPGVVPCLPNRLESSTEVASPVLRELWQIRENVFPHERQNDQVSRYASKDMWQPEMP